jgi:hypothetical protein
MIRFGLIMLSAAVACPSIGAAVAGLSIPWIIAAGWSGVVAFGAGVVAMGPYGR